MHLPDTPLRRIAGSLIGWLAFSFFFTLLVNAALTVMMQNGGFCAVGGPYEIAEGHGCSELVAWSAPVSIFGGLAAVGLGVWLGRGFGVPLVAWAWTILFVGLGIAFVIAFVSTWDWGFGIPGALFAVPVIAVTNVMVKYIAGGEWKTNPHPTTEDILPHA